MTNPSRFDAAMALRQGITALGAATEDGETLVSESSIDATLLLHSIGYEPVDFVFGVAAQSFPFQVWNSSAQPGFSQFPRGRIPKAAATFDAAFSRAKEKARARAAALGAVGVVDTTLSVVVRERYVLVQVRGTAIRPLESSRKLGAVARPFVSDVSARSLVGLVQMGYLPSDYVAGYGFTAVAVVNPPKFSQNAEITSLTQAMYESREAAMASLQRTAQARDIVGVVGIRTHEQRNLQFGVRIVMFRVTGTAVVRHGEDVEPAPQLILSLDESKLSFDPIVTHPSDEGSTAPEPVHEIVVQEVPKSVRLLNRWGLLSGSAD